MIESEKSQTEAEEYLQLPETGDYTEIEIIISEFNGEPFGITELEVR